MIAFTCPNCQKSLEAENHHAGNVGTCTRCGQPIQIPTIPRAGKAAPQSGNVQKASWYYEHQGQECGPFTFRQLQQLANTEQIVSSTPVRKSGMDYWVSAAEVGGLIVADRGGGWGRVLTWLVVLLLVGGVGAGVYFGLPYFGVNLFSSKKSLKDLAAERSPSVPLIICPGRGWGTGFLIRHGDKHLVVTNAHVIVGSRSGIRVLFLLPGKEGGGEERFEVPSEKVHLLAVHGEVDLALIDVSEAAAELTSRGIEPLTLLPRDHKTAQGETVFILGHPGDGGGGLLDRTLTNGIVSGVNRKVDEHGKERFIQVTAAINTGNSGGPIFNEEGKVLAVASAFLRDAKKEGLRREGLNLGLDVRHVHDFLEDRSPALKEKQVAQMRQRNGLIPEFALLKQFRQLGYQPFSGDEKTSVLLINFDPHGEFRHVLDDVRLNQRVHVFLTCENSADAVALYVYRSPAKGEKPIVKSDRRKNPDPEVTFQAQTRGDYEILVSNLNNTPTKATLLVLRK